MLNNHEFNRICSTLGLKDNERELAEIVWTRCERVMQGMSQQESVLLKPNKFKPKGESDTQPFTQGELQRLQVMLAERISHLHHEKSKSKHSASYAWGFSDKDRPKETSTTFAVLNYWKQMIRLCNKRIDGIESIQRKVKKLLRTKQK